MSDSVVLTAPAPTPPADPPRRHHNKRLLTGKIVYSTLAVIIALIMAFPVYWMINCSFLPTNLIRNAVPTFFPGDNFTWRNYSTVIFGSTTPGMSTAPFLPALLNSLKVGFLTVVIALTIGFLAALAVVRYKFFGRHGFIIAILMIQMIPGVAMMWTYYRMMDGWHLTNNVFGLAMLYICAALPFTIWTLRGFVLTVPPDLEEAAMVDGCSASGAFWRITFPLLAPGLVSTGIFAFITAWNEFTTALVMMNKPAAMTLPIWLRTFQQVTRATNWGALMAASTLVAIPVIVFFLIVQGRMTGGLVAGAVKG